MNTSPKFVIVQVVVMMHLLGGSKLAQARFSSCTEKEQSALPAGETSTVQFAALQISPQ
jgi:hypothetical protein